MNKVFEKIIEKLEEEKVKGIYDSSSIIGEKNVWGKAIEIVKQEAEQYNNGWIPCSERLPENISTVLVQVKEFESPTIGWYGNIAGWRLLEKDFDELNDFTVIAWQPLPQPYQPKGE